MKFSAKMEKCGLSPMRKFAGAAAAAEERGMKIYHLNIGQPDIATPEAYFDAIRAFSAPVLEYAPSAGENVLIDAVRGYYDKIGVTLDRAHGRGYPPDTDLPGGGLPLRRAGESGGVHK